MASVATSSSAFADTGNAATPAASSVGYGLDPDISNPRVPWARVMTPSQLKCTAILSDIILPGTKSAPAPSAIGVPDFINEWISAPYPAQLADRKAFLDGFAWLDDEALKRGSTDFLDAHEDHQQAIVDVMSKVGAPTATSATFFRRLRYLVVGAYYTTQTGFDEIGYKGNVALNSYPPPTQMELAVVEEELSKLGIK
jgi:hypothetical protein